MATAARQCKAGTEVMHKLLAYLAMVIPLQWVANAWALGCGWPTLEGQVGTGAAPYIQDPWPRRGVKTVRVSGCRVTHDRGLRGLDSGLLHTCSSLISALVAVFVN